MIPNPAIHSLLWLLAAPALAAEAPPEERDDALSEHRLPFSVLAERSIGVTSKAVEFNWRDGRVQVAATGSHYFELNNYSTMRAGGMIRIPSDGFVYELGLSKVWVWDSLASEQLALTPYRQPGRPPRLELDLSVGMPIAEGVVTAVPRRFPATQMVLNVYGSVRYSIYPFSYKGIRGRDLAAALASPTMSAAEIENLEERRLDAMQVDTARYTVMAGVGNDLYLSQGVLLSPRVMFAVPIFVPVNESDLRLWADFSLALGVAF